MQAHVASCHRRAAAAAFVVGSVIAPALTAGEFVADRSQPPSAIVNAVRPNPLLSIDRNRTTVVERIVATWGDALAQSEANLGKEQFATLLRGLRSDQLLAASLAGSLDGLRDVVANALTTTAPVPANLILDKALGDPDADLVYTPVAPCRIVDTRIAGGIFGAQETRNYHGYAAGGFAAQGGTGNNCGIPAYPSAVVLDMTVMAAPFGFHRVVQESLTVWPYGALQPAVPTLPYTSGQTVTLDAIVPVCHPGCADEFNVIASGANVVIDVVGYFRPATGGGSSGGLSGGGSTNWLAKWSDATTLTLANLYEDGGNVSIGGFTPVNRLQIGSTPSFSGNDIAIGNGTTGMSFFQTNAASIWYSSANAFALMPNAAAAGLVGIGTTTPANKLQIGSVGASGFGGNDVAFGDGTRASAFAQTPTVAWWYSTTDIALMPRGSGHGRVGINTTSPGYPLHVDDYVTYTSPVGHFAYFTQVIPDKAYVPLVADCAGCGAHVSIYASDNVLAAEMDVISDARIKDVMGVSNSGKDLDTINLLQVTDYTMKDKVRYGDRPFKKVVAQQVESVYPQVVSRQTDFVPNVYQAASEVTRTVAGYRLRFGSRHNLSPTAKQVKVLVSGEHTMRRATIVAIPSGNDVVIEAPWYQGGKLFVYGEEVDDFRTVDYDGLTALTISATQELAKRVAREQVEIDELHAGSDADAADLRRQLAEQKARVASLEAQVAQLSALKEDLAALRREAEAVTRSATIPLSPATTRAVSHASGRI